MVCTVKIGPFTSAPSANQIQVLDFCGQLKCFRKNKLNLLFVSLFPPIGQYAPYKQSQKGTHAERSRQLGLGEPAELLLKNPEAVRLEKLVKPGVKGTEKPFLYLLGLQFIQTQHEEQGWCKGEIAWLSLLILTLCIPCGFCLFCYFLSFPRVSF